MKISRFATVVAIAGLVLVGSVAPVLAQNPSFSDFSTTTNLALHGDAAQSGSVLRLTPASTGKRGSAWFQVLQPVARGFTTTFTFRIDNTGSEGPFPADGIAFVIQNADAGTAALGGGGGGIGYDGIPNSLAVEFDTHQNAGDPPVGANDPNANHVGVQSCGSVQANSSNHSAVFPVEGGFSNCNFGLNSSLLTTLADGTLHTVKIEYTSPADCGGECLSHLQVSLDNTPLFSPAIPLDLGDLLGLADPSDTIADSAYVGFTAATGDLEENNDILSWTFTPHGTNTSITQDTHGGSTTEYTFNAFNYKITPPSGNQNITVTAIPLPAGTAPTVSGIPNATCIPYDGTGPDGSTGKCWEFAAVCNSGSCGVNFDLSTSYDVAPGTVITNPGFYKGDSSPVGSTTPCSNPTFTSNAITAFLVQRNDPTTKGKSGGGLSCWLAVQGVTYAPTDMSITNLALPTVKSGTNLTYGMAVLNLGQNPATGISVTTSPVPPLPALASMTLQSSAVCITGKSGVTCTTNTSPIPPCVPNGSVVTCQVGNLLPFSAKTLAAAAIQLTFKVTGPTGTTINEKATVQAFNPEPSGKTTNNSSTAVTKIK